MYNELVFINFFKNFFQILKYNIKTANSWYIHLFNFQAIVAIFFTMSNLRNFRRDFKRYENKFRIKNPEVKEIFLMLPENTSEEICEWLNQNNYQWAKYPGLKENEIKIVELKKEGPSIFWVPKS